MEEKNIQKIVCLIFITVVVFFVGCVAQNIVVGQSEQVGFSPEKLERVDSFIGQHIESNKLAGAVVLIAQAAPPSFNVLRII
jgi:hypothetical protein